MAKGVLFFCLALLLCHGAPPSWSVKLSEVEQEEALVLFESWMARQANRAAFLENHAYVRQRNKVLKDYKLELNEFADWTDEQFARRRAGKGRFKENAPSRRMERSSPSLPSYLDWRDHGAVSAVVNQGQCEVCYAFASVASIESAWFLEQGPPLIKLSEMQILDCGEAFGNGNCKGHNATGGTAETAFKYVINNSTGLETETAYPYHTYDHSKCVYNGKPAATIRGYGKVEPSGSESALKTALQKKPIAVNFDATHKDFNFYKEGIYNNPHCKHIGTELDHMMLLVGYNLTDSSEQYYIVKNSWGPTWGYKGYIHVATGQNMCGIATEPAYPCVKHTTC